MDDEYFAFQLALLEIEMEPTQPRHPLPFNTSREGLPKHELDFAKNAIIDYIHRYEREGGLANLTEGIHLFQHVLDPQEPENPNRSASPNNLTSARRVRYERDSGDQELSDAIELYREGLALFPPGHPNRSFSLNNLARAIMTRHERDGGDQDLLEAIELYKEALTIRPTGHPNRSFALNNLANALLTRYERDGEDQHLSQAIELHRDAVIARPLGDPDRSSSLSNLAGAILTRYKRDSRDKDLSEAIELYKEALTVRPPGHPDHSTSLGNLARAILTPYNRDRGYQDPSEAIGYLVASFSSLPVEHPYRSVLALTLGFTLFESLRLDKSSAIEVGELPLMNEIIPLLRDAAAATASPISDRLNAALSWIDIAIERDPPSALEAYQVAFVHLGSALALGQSLQARHTRLLSQRTRPCPAKALALEAALWALSGTSPEPKLAVELLDQGRNVLLASVGQFRADLSDVRRQDPTLAEEFDRAGRMLESSILTGQGIPESKSPYEDTTSRYKRVSANWEAVVDKIRLLPGCESFLLPMPFTKLQEAAAEGPVIVILVGKKQSTAIIVISDGDPHTIDLPHASEKTLKRLHEEWEEALKHLPDESRVVRKLPRVLSQLWSTLVQPIIHELTDVLHVPLQSRIWWYPTSWASFLPLHAAGSYKKGGLNVPDLYVSSYTPTLQALTRGHQSRQHLRLDARPGLLMIAQPKSKGQDELVVAEEVVAVCCEVPNTLLLSDDQATRRNVLQELRNYSWIHLACHGISDLDDPFQSRFALDGGPLTLQDIIANHLPSAEFAYLSACHSAAQDRTLPDEGLNLAGGMQFAGFKSVVGTLWKMADNDAPMLAKNFYRSLAWRSGDGNGFDCTRAAEALHEAVQGLRAKKVPLFRWVNLVHYGI